MLRARGDIPRFLILVFMLSLVARAGDQGSDAVLNERVLEFARGKIGQVVGDGECTALVREALKYAGARRFPPRGRDWDSVWGERLESVSDALPGDVLQFHNAVFKGRKTFPNGGYRYWELSFPHHTAIVSGIKTTKGELIVTILHQNMSSAGAEKNQSKPVQPDSLNMSELQPGGQVTAYRPVAE
jgi:hypothetical protein